MSGTAESVVVSLGAGLIVLAIGSLIKRIPKFVTLLMAVGVVMIAFVLWPRATLVQVPDLSNLSRDEAELRLSSAKLVGAPQPQEASQTRPEHVVPGSQTPLPGTKVRPGTLVRYSISTPTSVLPGRTENIADSAMAPLVSIFSPRDGGNIIPMRGADNIFRFEVEGTIEGVDFAKSTLLLWVQPVNPPSDQPGWYLQRPPTNGVQSVSGNRWRGICQIGNAQYPPHDGDVVEIAASIVPAQKAASLEARQGPLTVIDLPGTVSQVVRVKVRLR